MKHLTIDEILDFVSMTELNSETEKLSATVNGHIRSCEKCCELVNAFQAVYDEFVQIHNSGDFKGFISGTEAAHWVSDDTEEGLRR